jgi:tetratricopeptide (TPR) repeat protein
MSKTKLLAVLIVAVCAAVVVVHWPALSAKALLFDDNEYLVDNALVKSPGLASAWRFLSEVFQPSTVPGYYQPLSMISLMLDYSLGGRADNLMPFHRTSLVLHAANTALIIILLYLLFGSPWIAAGVGLLFGLHPMMVETIPWVGERKTLLAAFFALWSLFFYVRYARAVTAAEEPRSRAGRGRTRRLSKKNSGSFLAKNRIDLWLCFILYLLALMSKPTSTPLPALMLLLDFWPLKRLNWRALLEKIPFFVLGGIFAIITYISQTKTGGTLPPTEVGMWRISLILCHNIIFYLYKIVWPANLSSHYPLPKPLELANSMVLAGVIGTCILIPLLIISLRWTRAAAGWLFFFIAIFPALGVIGFTNAVASDKFAYLPSFGLLMVLTSFLSWVCTTAEIVKPTLRYIAVFVFILAAASAESFAVRNYLVHWRNSVGLYEYMLSLAPNSPLLHNGLGIALSSEGRLDEALSQYRQAIKLQSSLFDAYTALSRDKTDEASSRHRQALQIAPHYAASYVNMGIILKSQGKSEDALDCFRKALQIQPDNAQAHFNLGIVLQEQGKLKEAAAHFSRTFAANPSDAEFHYKLGVSLQSQGKFDEAMSHYRKAVQLRPDYAEAHNNLGMLLAQQGNLDEAISHFRDAVRINPNYIRAHFNLATALSQEGKFDEAISPYRFVLQREPNNAQVYYNIGVALQSQGKVDEALYNFRQAMRLNPAWPLPISQIAQILSLHPDTKIRDSKQAVKLAERAAELTNHKDAEVLNTLATAYAADGQLDKAIVTAQAALQIADKEKNTELSTFINQQLNSFRQAQQEASSRK